MKTTNRNELNSYPSEAISAGIATAIRPTAAVAVSNDVLKAYLKFFEYYTPYLKSFVSINTIYGNLCTLILYRLNKSIIKWFFNLP